MAEHDFNSKNLTYSLSLQKSEDEVLTKLTKRFKTALKKERSEDVAQMQDQISSLPPKILAYRGLAVLNICISNIRTALGGSMVLELEPDSAISDEFDRGIGIRNGDIVALENMRAATEKKAVKGSGHRVEGVILRISPKAIHISVDDKFAETATQLEGRFWIVKLANSITYTRMDETMEDLSLLNPPTNLQRIVLGTLEPNLVTSQEQVLEYFDETLNDSQKKAIKFCLGPSEVAIVHGPPGTGKTYTVIEIIRQLVARNQRVLVCGPSNMSVDTILERLDNLLPPDSLLRIGHPARLLPSILRHSLEVILWNSDSSQIVRDIREEIGSNFAKIKKTKSGREKSEIYKDIKLLRKEYRIREKKALQEVLNNAKVIVCTLHGAGSGFLAGIEFNSIIIDEVSQSLEPQCWIPLIHHPEATKLIIAGDNKQLPPTIKAAANEKALGTTLFDRLVSIHGDKIRNLLNVQYRMNHKIMEFPSQSMYEGKLVAAEMVANQTLANLQYVCRNEFTETKVLWIDTQGGEFPENLKAATSTKLGRDENVSSSSNDLEAWLVVQEIAKLLKYGIRVEDIGVIAPYNAQVNILSKRIEAYLDKHVRREGAAETLEISSVDGFQGREKIAIIMSMVRSNDKGDIGFLKDDRRLNVAITRPRMYLCIIGDSETLARGSKFLKAWVKWAEDNAEIEYPDVGDVLSFGMDQTKNE
ncbi:P-loop containing nucleoside triphosphate hydrolase protein [Lipomyces oligophaga]|uniref:P-loop containing nucleoside triphosphate hydrolase protein n=1 Tax=Lipomyces oligophaga TaxID=45792 RepID=UPI0034CFE3F9